MLVFLLFLWKSLFLEVLTLSLKKYFSDYFFNFKKRINYIIWLIILQSLWMSQVFFTSRKVLFKQYYQSLCYSPWVNTLFTFRNRKRLTSKTSSHWKAKTVIYEKNFTQLFPEIQYNILKLSLKIFNTKLLLLIFILSFILLSKPL